MRWPTVQSTTRPHFSVLQGRFSPFRLRLTFMRHPTRSTICFANSGRLALNYAVSPKITLAWRKLLTLTGRRNHKSLLTRFLSGFQHGRVSLNVEDAECLPQHYEVVLNRQAKKPLREENGYAHRKTLTARHSGGIRFAGGDIIRLADQGGGT